MSGLQAGRYDSAAPSGETALGHLLSNASVELGPNRAQDATAIAAKLPQGTSVFVSHLPRHTLAQSLPAVQSLFEAGLHPVPHIAARRVASREELAAFLRTACRRAGVRRLLLIGGDKSSQVKDIAKAQQLAKDYEE